MEANQSSFDEDLRIAISRIHCTEREGLVALYRSEKEAFSTIGTPQNNIHSVALIEGPSGVGKSTLVDAALRDAVLQDEGFWIKVKFDAFPHPEPYFAIVESIADWVINQLEDGAPTLKEVAQDLICGQMSDELDDLVRLIPPLNQFLRREGAPPKKSVKATGAEAIHQFNYMFRNFIAALSSSSNHPVVLFLDDLEMANAATLDLLDSLMQQDAPINAPFVVVATHNSQEATDVTGEKIESLVTQWSDKGVKVKHTHLGPLEEQMVCKILVDTFSLSLHNEQTKSVCSNVFRLTSGNLFHLVELLRSLNGQAEWGAAAGIESACAAIEKALSSNDYLVDRLIALPPRVQLLLRSAACVGSRIHPTILRLAVKECEFDDDILVSMESGLVVQSGEHYCFAHACIHKAVCRSIPAHETSRFHFDIGRRLWRGLSMDELNDFVYVVVDHLIAGMEHLVGQKQRYGAARLCLSAGEKAAGSCCFELAQRYLMHGIALLGDGRWREEYKLCLDLYAGAAEVAYFMASYDDVNRLTEDIFANSRTERDKRRAQTTKLHTLATSGRVLEAVDHGCRVLASLGCSLPQHHYTSKLGVASGVLWVVMSLKRRLRGKSNEQLLRLPLMTDPDKLTTMQLLNNMLVYAGMSKREMMPFIAHRMLMLTLNDGICAMSSLGFVAYGGLLCSLHQIDDGYRYAELALAMQSRYPVSVWLGRLNMIFYSWIFPHKHPFRDTLPHLEFGRRLCLQLGDREMSLVCSFAHYIIQLDITPIQELVQIVSRVRESMAGHGHEMNLKMVQPSLHMLLSLSSRNDGYFGALRKVRFDEAMLDQCKGPNHSVYLWSEYARMFICYLFKDYNQALHHSEQCKPILEDPSTFGDFSIAAFFVALTHVEMARVSRKRHHLRKARRCLKQLQRWASHSPSNFLGKTFLVEAEIAALHGKHDEAHRKYNCSISLGRDAGFYVLTALGHERAGKLFWKQGIPSKALSHFEKAMATYEKYGADAKVDQLQLEIANKFPTLQSSRSLNVR